MRHIGCLSGGKDSTAGTCRKLRRRTLVSMSNKGVPMRKKLIPMKVVEESRVSCHVENGDLIIDECVNFDPADIPEIFPEWMVNAIDSTDTEKK